MSETELVTRARAGDGAAWETLIQQHQEAVFRLAYLILGDAADADDVAQETFIRAFHSLARFDATRPLRPWLLKITVNLARNWRRALGRYIAALKRSVQADPLAGASEAPALHPWEAQQLWQAVQRLRPVDQEIIYLRYFLELPEGEAADVLGVARGTVKSRLHRALERLRGVVERDFPALQEGYHEQATL